MNLSFGSVGRAVTAAICVTALSSCAETELGAHFIKSAARTADSATPPLAAAPTAKLAPERFAATGLTIWDGAATLEGVWIAHPKAKRAQRVKVRNTQTGREAESAMFPRDAEMAGPSIIISSEAAHRLGLTPGEPTEIAITAIGDAEAPIDPVGAPRTRPIETAARQAPIEDASSDLSATPPMARPAFRSEDAPTPPLARPTLAVAAQETAALDTRTPAPRVRPDHVAAPTPGGAYLQVGAFKIEANAAALVDRLRARGQPVHQLRGGAEAENIHIILIGPLADGEIAAARAAAEAEGIVDAIEVTP